MTYKMDLKIAVRIRYHEDTLEFLKTKENIFFIVGKTFQDIEGKKK